jgi:ribosome recycling factor|tara:strand:- start:219 stop:917 length:699 start_codon:yes stop_codon:yes gene_type:complete
MKKSLNSQRGGEKMAEEFEDSYSSEALQNMEEYMFSFGDTIKDIGSEDAFKNALFGMKVMVEKKPRRIADLGKVMIGTKPRTLDVMPFAREHVELIAKEIKANNLKNVKFDVQQQLITVTVPKPTLDDLQAMEDQVASMSRSAINSLVKIKGMTTARVKKAVENEFIDGVTASKSTKKVDDVFDKYVRLVKLHSIKKRQNILGSYYEPKDGEENSLLPEVKKLKPLPKRPDK